MDKKFYVIYRITNLTNGYLYIGAHSTNNLEDAYMGSSKRLKQDVKKLGRLSFKKEILHVFDNKEDMMSKEAEIVNKEFCYRSDTYNQRVGGGDNFTTTGMVCVRDQEGNTFSVYLTDPRYISGELKPLMSGKANVKDKNGNVFQVFKDDPRLLSGELEWCTKGKIGNKGHQGHKHSDITKALQSEKAKLRGSNRTGKKHSEETKEKIRKAKFKLRVLREDNV